MTTNQTIDGVPRLRELLEQLVDPVNHIGRVKARAELRALLDAPAPCAEFKKVEMAHVMNALEDVRGKPVLTSNQCHDLARAMNDRLLSPLQLLAMPAEYLAAAQPQGDPAGSFDKHMQYMQENIELKKRIAELESKSQGEPVAWRVTGRGGLTVTPQYPKWAVGERGLTITPLYAEQPAPVAVVMDDNELIAIARKSAVESPQRYAYMPHAEDAATWVPHRWVVDAMRTCLDEPKRLNTARPAHSTPPPGTEPSGTHHDNDGLDEMRKPQDDQARRAELLESLAQQIYDSWQTQPGWVPWHSAGPSQKKIEARAMASRVFELALANQVGD